MTEEERIKLVDLRVRSKMGETLNDAETLFIREMFNKFPKEYPSDKEIFDIVKNLVNPFYME